MGFNIDNYELVEDRLKKFWADYPNGRVNTDVVGKSEDGTMVIVKAELFTDIDSKIPVSSGLAQETKGVGGFANNEAWLENCESSAIGRALANWKYQGNKKARPSREEMAKVERNSVTPTTDTKKKAEESKPSSKKEDSNKKEIVLADEISPDTCRLWDSKTEKKLDKDRFRKDLGNIIQAYQEVARRLGIVPETTNVSEVNFNKPTSISIKKK